MRRAFTGVERPVIRLARKLQPGGIQFLAHPLEKNVAIKLPDRTRIILPELPFRRLVRRGRHVASSKYRQKRQRIVSAPRLELLAHVRRPRRMPCLVAVEKNEFQPPPYLLADVFFDVSNNTIKMEIDRFGIHLVAFKPERLYLGGMDERPHGNMLDSDAVYYSDFLKIRMPRRNNGTLGPAGLEIVQSIDRSRTLIDLLLHIRDIEYELSHGKTRRNPAPSARSVARAIVNPYFNAALLGFLAGELDKRPPFRRESHDLLDRRISELHRARRARIGKTENGDRADPHLLEPVKILEDRLLGDIRAHPMPPRTGLCRCGNIAKDLLR